MGSVLCCPLAPGLWQQVLSLHWGAVMHFKHPRQEGQVNLAGVPMTMSSSLQERAGTSVFPCPASLSVTAAVDNGFLPLPFTCAF